MYNVIVAYDTTAWETDQLMRLPADRFKEYSGGPEADQLDLTKPATLKLLDDVPTLLFYEAGAEGPAAKIVRYGTVSSVHHSKKGEIVFRFTEKGRFSRAVLDEIRRAGSISAAGRPTRTHWAIKEGGIPSAMLSRLRPTYDIVFSFAGEDRAFVAQVARYLRARQVTVFYDEYEQADLWGKDLAEHFDTVYGQSGRYCVIFISAAYVAKMWTRLERRTALARALKEHQDYILPARFDNTPVDGIRETTGYISLSGLAPAKFGREISRNSGARPDGYSFSVSVFGRFFRNWSMLNSIFATGGLTDTPQKTPATCGNPFSRSNCWQALKWQPSVMTSSTRKIHPSCAAMPRHSSLA
jgi:hypothetical protein